MKESIKLLMWVVMLTLTITSCSNSDDEENQPSSTTSTTETFTFSSNGVDLPGNIYLPASYETNSNLPAIYLIDYKEQTVNVATDEFQQVINAVQVRSNFDALVVTLTPLMDPEATDVYQDYYDIFKNMTTYVDANYTNSTSRTFIGRGTQAGVVIMTMLLEDPVNSVFDNFIATDMPDFATIPVTTMFQNDNFPANISNKKLHYSFSSGNTFTNPQALSRALIQLIEDKQYPWLTFDSIEYANNDFENTYKQSFAAGINFVFN